jgi:hypothetical protein
MTRSWTCPSVLPATQTRPPHASPRSRPTTRFAALPPPQPSTSGHSRPSNSGDVSKAKMSRRSAHASAASTAGSAAAATGYGIVACAHRAQCNQSIEPVAPNGTVWQPLATRDATENGTPKKGDWHREYAEPVPFFRMGARRAGKPWHAHLMLKSRKVFAPCADFHPARLISCSVLTLRAASSAVMVLRPWSVTM